MKACGISLYRIAAPMFVVALAVGAGLFLLQETILGPSKQRAEQLQDIIRGQDPQIRNLLTNRWLVGTNGEFYHYLSLEPRNHVLTGLDLYQFTPGMDRLVRRTFAEIASLADDPSGKVWQIHKGWAREFDEHGDVRADGSREIVAERRTLETADYFGTEKRNPDHMSYTQLRGYTEKLRAGGFDVSAQEVALGRKSAFPFVVLIMTLLAVPFASTIGRAGAMGGIGVGIVLAISYWTLISVFAALGAGGALPPILAAWAPNLLFGAAALYLLLTVRT
jgi:LPS export ABC transporter permease LptG